MGFLPSSSRKKVSVEAYAAGIGTRISLYPLTKLRNGMLLDLLGICASGVVEYRYDIDPSICPSVERVYAVAKWGVLRDDTCRERVDGVANESRASEVAVRAE